MTRFNKEQAYVQTDGRNLNRRATGQSQRFWLGDYASGEEAVACYRAEVGVCSLSLPGRATQKLRQIIFAAIIGLIMIAALPAGAQPDGLTETEMANAQYQSDAMDCTLLQVSTQYANGAHQPEFSCIEGANPETGADGRVLELKGLPSNFRQRYRQNLAKVSERLRAAQASNTRRSGDARKLRARHLEARKRVRNMLRANRTYRVGDTLYLTEGSDWEISEDANSMEAEEAALAQEGGVAEAITYTDESNVLVLRITTADSAPTPSASQLSDSVFGTYGDPVNLVSQYAACSYGKKTFVPAEGPNIVDGVAEVTVGINAAGSSRYTVMNAATTAANALVGSLGANYDHVLYAIPPGTDGSWIAFGYYNNYRTVYNNNWATYVSAQMHEVGHNFILDHSSEGSSEYGDTQGMMGFSYSQDDSPIMCFNAAKSSQLSWYNDKEITISQSWSGKVIGLADYGSAASDQNVIVRAENDDGDSLFITYNRKTGINSGTREGGNQVTVVEGRYQNTSNLLAKLNNGGTYTYSNFWGSGDDFVLTVDDITTDFNNVQYAQVRIQSNDSEPTYALSVNNGSGDGSYPSGSSVNISANSAPSGQEFDRWVVNSGGVSIANANASATSLTMASSDATVTATYKAEPVPTYSLTVNNGSGDGEFASGDEVQIVASAPPSGQEFDRWIINSGSAEIVNTNSPETTLVMNSGAVTVTATYEDLP
ncbi:MAG: hypothetical protein AAGI44_09080, partial [Pseudomonadota bacterium]